MLAPPAQQSLTHFPCLWTCPFQTCHIDGIAPVALCIRPLSLSVECSQPIHVPANVRPPTFTAGDTPLCGRLRCLYVEEFLAQEVTSGQPLGRTSFPVSEGTAPHVRELDALQRPFSPSLCPLGRTGGTCRRLTPAPGPSSRRPAGDQESPWGRPRVVHFSAGPSSAPHCRVRVPRDTGLTGRMHVPRHNALEGTGSGNNGAWQV